MQHKENKILLSKDGSEALSYQLVKSKRKTWSVTVKPDGTVIVGAPLFMSQKQIEELLMQKIQWIRTKLDEMPQHGKPERKFLEGELFDYLGHSYCLVIDSSGCSKNGAVRQEKDSIYVCVLQKEQELIRQYLQRWYQEQMKYYLQENVLLYAKRMGVMPKAIRIKNQKSRWGSCSSKGNLNFNWRLIMAPSQVLDYVIVHELSHLKHMDHSEAFWCCVAEIIPNYKQLRKWLKDNGEKLYW